MADTQLTLLDTTAPTPTPEARARYWARNNDGTLVCAAEYDTMDQAVLAARVWNRSETRPHMRVDVVSNAEITAHATRVRAVY